MTTVEQEIQTKTQYSMPFKIWQQKKEITQTQNSMPLKIWQTNEKITQNSNSILSATQHLTTVEQVI